MNFTFGRASPRCRPVPAMRSSVIKVLTAVASPGTPEAWALTTSKKGILGKAVSVLATRSSLGLTHTYL